MARPAPHDRRAVAPPWRLRVWGGGCAAGCVASPHSCVAGSHSSGCRSRSPPTWRDDNQGTCAGASA
eukprot:scaffold114889_cov36-Phaeocystis_antarctica.AAC.1